MKLYHGSNANIIDLLDSPRVSKCINGIGFYCSRDLSVAQQYGSKVVCYEVEDSFSDFVERPIDQRYVDGLASYAECAEGGMEVVITNPMDMVLDHVINSYEV